MVFSLCFRNEAYNSRVKKQFGSAHENLHMWSNVMTKEAKKAEYEMDILVGGGVVRPPSGRYEDYAERRISLMKSYAKGEISRHNFLISIGGQTWKQSHDSIRKSTSDSSEKQKKRKGSRPTSVGDNDPRLGDDTRAVSPVHSEDSDVDQPDPFPQRPVIARNQQIAAAHEARRRQKKCPPKPLGCGKGFVFSKNTWLECTGPCSNIFHKRCLTADEKFREPFICFTCLPDAVLAPGKCFSNYISVRITDVL